MSFALVQVIVGGLLLGAVYALFSSGLTLVWGMMNVVNFAHGDFVMLGMYVAFVVYTVMGGGPLLGAPLAILLLATLGIIVYFALIRDIMKGPMLAQILGTFGLALLLRYSVFCGSVRISIRCRQTWSAAPLTCSASASRPRGSWPAWLRSW